MKPSPFRDSPRQLARAAIAFAAGVCALALVSSPARAQAPGVPPGPAPAIPGQAQPSPGRAPGGNFWRITFFTLDQWSFTTHPFAQITGVPAFDDGRAASGTSLDFSAASSDAKAPFPTQELHSLPPFSLEAGRTLTIFLPKAISFGLDYYAFHQRDVDVTKTGPNVPPIVMDTYLYQFDVRAFIFDPTTPGLNYYVGIGVGTLQGKLTASPSQAQAATNVSYGETATGATLFGIEAKGESIGLRYELAIIGASQVALDSNPYTGSGRTRLDFSGSITRLALYYQF